MTTKKMTVHYEGKPIYDIVFAHDFGQLQNSLSAIQGFDRKICVVSDSHVAPHYLDEVVGILKEQADYVTSFVFEAGEKSKNLDVVRNLYEFLIQEHFERRDLLVALGGGVVGDLTGYTAATYLRGIDFVQIPTSLLAQVDSSIGGKTGVDFDSYKNMVGAFHQPKLVYINTATLQTLSVRQYLSGMGEVIKYGIIKDLEFYDWIAQNKEAIKSLEKEAVLKMIYRSCDNKRIVVEQDPTEKGERALLNYGHTLGHAIEKLSNFSYLHGECVAVGSILAAQLSQKKGFLTQQDVDSVTELFDFFDFPKITSYNVEQVLETVKSDKKMTAGKIRFILSRQIGDAFISEEVSNEDMRAVLEDYHE